MKRILQAIWYGNIANDLRWIDKISSWKERAIVHFSLELSFFILNSCEYLVWNKLTQYKIMAAIFTRRKSSEKIFFSSKRKAYKVLRYYPFPFIESIKPIQPTIQPLPGIFISNYHTNKTKFSLPTRCVWCVCAVSALVQKERFISWCENFRVFWTLNLTTVDSRMSTTDEWIVCKCAAIVIRRENQIHIRFYTLAHTINFIDSFFFFHPFFLFRSFFFVLALRCFCYSLYRLILCFEDGTKLETAHKIYIAYTVTVD